MPPQYPPPLGGPPPPPYRSSSDELRTDSPSNSGMAIASLVLSLVGIVPCFWAIQIPGLLGIIFGVVGLRRTAGGVRRGHGMALAGLIVGIVLVVGCAAFWIFVATSGNCQFDNGNFSCTSN